MNALEFSATITHGVTYWIAVQFESQTYFYIDSFAKRRAIHNHAYELWDNTWNTGSSQDNNTYNLHMTYATPPHLEVEAVVLQSVIL
jgi:hypothetical protein